jgi:hypothetical protein
MHIPDNVLTRASESRLAMRPKDAYGEELRNYLTSLPEWHDVQRRTALYGAIPIRDVNPTGWKDRTTFWTKAIKNAIQLGHVDGNHVTVGIDVEKWARAWRGEMGQQPRPLVPVLVRFFDNNAHYHRRK